MLSVKLESFEGPLDLLLHLIEKNKLSIYDIPIAVITDQYLEYVNAMDKKDLNLVSDFLVMAATLLDMKSRMLLPAKESEEKEENDPREELARRLAEYKLYKHLGQELLQQKKSVGCVFYKESTIPPEVSRYEEPVDMEKMLEGITLQKLQDLFMLAMKRQVDKMDPVRSKFGSIPKDPIRLSEKLSYIFAYAQKHRRFVFESLVSDKNNKTDIVVTFLACLELVKVGRLFAEQEQMFGAISLVWNESCDTEIGKETMEEYD